MKRTWIIVLAAVLCVGLIYSNAYAYRGPEGPRKYHGRKAQKDQFFKKVKLIYRFQDELEVTEEQLDKIKEIKIALKKDVIMKKAEIDVIKVDIKAALREEEIDVSAVNALIDKKYEIKKAKAKATVAAIADLKKVLTEEQKDKLKTLIKEKKSKCHFEGKRDGRFGGPEGCPMKGRPMMEGKGMMSQPKE